MGLPSPGLTGDSSVIWGLTSDYMAQLGDLRASPYPQVTGVHVDATVTPSVGFMQILNCP